MKIVSWLIRAGINPRTETGLQDGCLNVSYTGELSGVGGMFTPPIKPLKGKHVHKKIKTKKVERQGEPPVKKMLQVR